MIYKNRIRKTIIFLFFTVLAILIVRFIFLLPPDLKTQQKLNHIKAELTKEGYHNRWFVISGLRYNWYNKLVQNSAKKSYHLKGKAVDIFVFDVDGDWRFTNKDIQILRSVNKKVETSHPDLVGAFGTYTKKSGLTKNMVHLDTRGYPLQYNY